MTDVPEIEEFEDVEEVEASSEETPAEESPTKVKVVQLVNLPASCCIIPADGFEVTLNSVGGRDYPFTEVSKCLSWITRRVYNGEELSENVQGLHTILSFARTANTISRKVDKLAELLEEDVDLTQKRAVNSVGTRVGAIEKALVEDSPEAFEPFFEAIDAIIDAGAALADAEITEITEEREAGEPGEDGEVEVETVVTGHDTSAAEAALAALREAVANFETVSVSPDGHVEIDI